MRVLVYAPLAVLGHHFETDLELVENHLLKGDDVFFLGCSGKLKPLEFYACRGTMRCQHCTSRRVEGLNQLSSGKLTTALVSPIQPVNCTEGLNLNSRDAVRAFCYKDNDIGSAYLSSLISDFGDPLPDMPKYREHSKKSLALLAGLVDFFAAHLDQVKPDLVYLFNGRYNLYRPLLRLCQARGIKFYAHERGPNNQRYSLTENNLPHDIATKTKEMIQAWRDPEVTKEQKMKIGSAWFEGRARGIVTAWHSFTSQQKAELLPQPWDATKQNIAFFTSSDNEFASVPGYEMELFPSQIAAIEFVCEQLKNNPQYQIYVRMHPNMLGLRNPNIEAYYELSKRHDNCHVIAPESPVSTYSLVKAASKVITFVTTVGIEAVYWGTPSILLGKSYYMSIGAVEIPKNKNEVMSLIENRNLQPGPKEAAVMYGYWGSTMGVPFRHYQAENLTTGAFKGHVITGNRWIMWLSYFFVLITDLGKILRGQYSFFLLQKKIRNKISLIKPSRSA